MTTSKTITEQIIDFFASVKLALFLLISLALASIIGTLIQQNLTEAEYLNEYSRATYSFFYSLDFFDMYHSWWFNTLLGLLIANLVVCSLKRLPKTMKLAKTISGDRAGPEYIEKQPFFAEKTWDLDPDQAKKKAQELIKKNFKQPRQVDSKWGTMFIAHKGAYSRFGAYFIHMSLIFFMVGALVGNFFGFKAYLSLEEGRSTNIVQNRKGGVIELPFTMRLNKFHLKLYDTGTPSEFRSDVTISKPGQEPFNFAIRVNHPLTQDGIIFYQSSYNSYLEGGIRMKLVRRRDKKVFYLRLQPNRFVNIPDGSGKIMYAQFRAEYGGFGPAAQVIVRYKGRQSNKTIVFKENSKGFRPIPGPFNIHIDSFKMRYSTGLQVNRDPGIWFIWIGCALMLTGFMMAFMFSHQKLFVGLVPDGKRIKLLVGGTVNRNEGLFKVKFNKLMEHFTPTN